MGITSLLNKIVPPIPTSHVSWNILEDDYDCRVAKSKRRATSGLIYDLYAIDIKLLFCTVYIISIRHAKSQVHKLR